MSNENEKTCTKCTVDVQFEDQTDNDYYVIRNWQKKPTLDHLYDCDKMQIVAAAIFDLIGVVDTPKDEKE